ncbi:hypothetical protein HP572_22480 [Pectobacterium sp. PL64]|uniref:hypothetical protein n=1 Tax=Pectobacterium sp. PL64 TaxID=2738983 RepID=UPI001F0B7F4D|nr:hypothetical protein [Pectobacterium sp. PL64]UMO87974.1 hypothetical protein HP572_22480 [Pectobacterium sp. PL64]
MKLTIFLLVLLTIVVSSLWIYQGFENPWYLLSEEQHLYIYSTQAQVIAAIYGLTVTGYIFLRNNQDKQKESDSTKTDAISLTQNNERVLLFALTFFSLSTILLAVFTLVSFDDKVNMVRVFSKNLCTAFFIITIFLFCYFILYVLRLDKIEKASEEIKKSIDKYEKNKTSATQSSSDMNGNESELNDSDTIEEKNENENQNYDDTTDSLALFLYKFNQLESFINRLLNKLYSNQAQSIGIDLIPTHYYSSSRKGKRHRSISIALNELVKFGRIDSRLNNDLREIIKYRNALVHGQDLIPSKIMIQKIDRIAKEVESLLGS